MTTQPEALRLADELDVYSDIRPHQKEAAIELRRLHAENEALRAALEQPRVEPVTDEENERFSQDVSNFPGADPEATKYALEAFLKNRTIAPPQPAPQPDARTAAIQDGIDSLIFGGKQFVLQHHFAKDLGEE